MRRVTFIAFWIVGALVWAALPAAGLWWLANRSTTAEFAPAKRAESPVVSSDKATVLPIKILISQQPGVKVNAPAWTGLIQQVHVAAGDNVTTGTPALTIDGVTRLFAHSPAPFWRAIGTGTKGSDVRALNTLLTELKFAAGTGDTVSNATLQGIKQLTAKIGAASSDTFDPGWLVWLPTPALAIGSINVTANMPAPSAGTEVVTSTPTITQAMLVSEGTTIADPAPASGVGDDDQTPATTEQVNKATTPTYQLPAGATVKAGDVVVEVGEKRDQVTEAGLPALVPLLGEGQLIDAQVTIPATPEQVAVPPGAVFTTTSGASCVLRVRDRAEHSVKVAVLGGDYTASFVTGDLQDGDRVVVDVPAASRQCG